MNWCLCEVESFFDKEFDGSLCRFRKVLQIFRTKEEAEFAALIFDPGRYGEPEYIRVVNVSELDKPFR